MERAISTLFKLRRTPTLSTSVGLLLPSSSARAAKCRTRHLARSLCTKTSSLVEPSPAALFTEEHFEIRRTVQKIVDEHINPYVDDWEKAGIFPAHEVFKILGDAGLLGVNKPVECGGLGLDYSFSMAVAEELGGINCAGIPMAIGVQTDMCTPALAMFGSEELKEEFLVPSIKGDMVGCIGVSEAGAGSDVASVKTTATEDGDDLIINGSKMWITNGTQADWICLLANTSKGPAHSNKSLIIVPMKSNGVQVSRKLSKLGMHASDTAEIHFQDVRVPKKNIVGEAGMGFMFQMTQFQQERLFSTALSLRMMERGIEDTIAYTAERMAYGKPLLSNQVIHFRLAELQTEVELLRALLYRATSLYIRGDDVVKLASMCKLKTGRLCRELADSCLQYWGGMGYSSESSINRMYRDSRLASIGGGADEVMLSIICKYMGTLPKEKN